MDFEGENFSISGDKLKFSGMDIQTALYKYPELAHITQDSAPSSATSRFALKIEVVDMKYLIVYLVYNLGIWIPFEILDYKGRDTVSDDIKRVFFSHTPIDFLKIYNEREIKKHSSKKDMEHYIEKLEDNSITHISHNLDSEDTYIYRKNDFGLFSCDLIPT
jgi:hypothetical protein